MVSKIKTSAGQPKVADKNLLQSSKKKTLEDAISSTPIQQLPLVSNKLNFFQNKSAVPCETNNACLPSGSRLAADVNFPSMSGVLNVKDKPQTILNSMKNYQLPIQFGSILNSRQGDTNGFGMASTSNCLKNSK